MTTQNPQSQEILEITIGSIAGVVIVVAITVTIVCCRRHRGQRSPHRELRNPLLPSDDSASPSPLNGAGAWAERQAALQQQWRKHVREVRPLLRGVSWRDIHPRNAAGEKTVLGTGQYGTVLDCTVRHMRVAVKVSGDLTVSPYFGSRGPFFALLCGVVVFLSCR